MSMFDSLCIIKHWFFFPAIIFILFFYQLIVNTLQFCIGIWLSSFSICFLQNRRQLFFSYTDITESFEAYRLQAFRLNDWLVTWWSAEWAMSHLITSKNRRHDFISDSSLLLLLLQLRFRASHFQCYVQIKLVCVCVCGVAIKQMKWNFGSSQENYYPLPAN